MKNCPFCSKEIPNLEYKCPYCGSGLVRFPGRDCPFCKKPITPSVNKCPYCKKAVPVLTSYYPRRPLVTVRIRSTYICLGLLGLLGIHNIYAGYYGKAAMQLFISVGLGWMYGGIVITGVWVIIDLITVRADAEGRAMI
jgi:hypothetical protein